MAGTHEALTWNDPSSGIECTMAFGYMQDMPTAALFIGESDTPVLIPREVLEAAVRTGWPADGRG